MSMSVSRRQVSILVALALALAMVLVSPEIAQAVCPGGPEDTWSDDTDNGALTISGISGHVTLSRTKDANGNSTCADLNVSYVQFTDEYAAQYRTGGGTWITGSAGVKTLTGGTQSPWWEPITNLQDTTPFRGWCDNLDRIMTFKS